MIADAPVGAGPLAHGRPAGLRAASALGRVDATVDGVRRLLGGVLDDADAFVVGSLAAGLGNPGSDVDVHVFGADYGATTAPMVFFLGRTIVDVQCFPISAVADLCAQHDRPHEALRGSPCALAAAPDRKTQQRLGRWTTALPLEGDRDLTDSRQHAAIAGLLVRAAIEEMIVHAAAALTLERSDAAMARFAWQRTARGLVELVVRIRGDVYPGFKWTWAKARRLGVAAELAGPIAALVDESGFVAALQAAGLPRLAPADLVAVAARPSEPVSLGGRALRLFDGRRLVEDVPSELADGSTVGTVIAEHGADRLAELLALGLVTLTAMDDAIDEAIRR